MGIALNPLPLCVIECVTVFAVNFCIIGSTQKPLGPYIAPGTRSDNAIHPNHTSRSDNAMDSG